MVVGGSNLSGGLGEPLERVLSLLSPFPPGSSIGLPGPALPVWTKPGAGRRSVLGGGFTSRIHKPERIIKTGETTRTRVHDLEFLANLHNAHLAVP